MSTTAISPHRVDHYVLPHQFRKGLPPADKQESPVAERGPGFLRTQSHRLLNYLLSVPKTKPDFLKLVADATIGVLVATSTPGMWKTAYELLDGHVIAASTGNKDIPLVKQELPKDLNRILWGENGPNIDQIPQYGSDCQVLPDIINYCLTPKKLEQLKSMVTITDYNLDENDFYINAVVDINGDKVEVSYTDLKSWRKYARELIDKEFPNHTYGPDIVERALVKKLDSIGHGVPHTKSSIPSTVFTGQKHSFVYLNTLSDDHLASILKSAPGATIKLSTFPNKDDYMNRLSENSGFGGIASYNEAPEVDNNGILSNHCYLGEGHEERDGETFYKLRSFNPNTNKSITLERTLEELRSEMMGVSAPSELIKPIDSNSMRNISIGALFILLVLKAHKASGKKEI